MANKPTTPERIIGLLQREKVDLAQGRTVRENSRGIRISVAT